MISTSRGKIYTVREVALAVVTVVCSAEASRPKEMSTCMLDVLVEWGSTWIWDNLRLVGDDNCIEECFEAGTFLAVTDGSYIEKLYPEL